MFTRNTVYTLGESYDEKASYRKRYILC